MIARMFASLVEVFGRSTSHEQPTVSDESRARVERAWDEVFARLERRKRERTARDSTVIYHTNAS